MSPTVITATLLVASYFRVQFTLSSPAPCEDATYSISNTVLAHHVFITKPSGNIEDCVLHCMGHSLCHSSNYYRQTKLCELNDKTDASNPEDMTEVYGALYMTNGLNPLPCRFLDSECGKLDICSTDSSGNKCKGDCGRALGMETGEIPDSAITASSFHESTVKFPRYARLNSYSSWASGSLNLVEWLQVDLARTMVVKKVATQGRNVDGYYQWVTAYKISSSVDASHWVMYQENNTEKIFEGNTDRNTVVSHVLLQHIRARFVKFWPRKYHGYVSMRVELYGCSLK